MGRPTCASATHARPAPNYNARRSPMLTAEATRQRRMLADHLAGPDPIGLGRRLTPGERAYLARQLGDSGAVLLCALARAALRGDPDLTLSVDRRRLAAWTPLALARVAAAADIPDPIPGLRVLELLGLRRRDPRPRRLAVPYLLDTSSLRLL